MKKPINIVNKKARFEYELIGSEVKAIREGKASISESYCYFNNGELFVKGMNISDYGYGSFHETTRDRKLLLKKKELKDLESQLTKGYAIVPYRIFIDEKGLIKMEIVLGRGKKLHDKRETIRSRDIQKEIQRNLK